MPPAPPTKPIKAPKLPNVHLRRLDSAAVIARDVLGVGAYRLCAAIYDGPRLVSVGQNSRKTHPLAVQFSGFVKADTLHAELDAIIRGLKTTNNLRGTTLYVARVSYSQNRERNWTSMARPCVGCMKAIKHYGISRVYWTSGPGEWGCLEI